MRTGWFASGVTVAKTSGGAVMPSGVLVEKMGVEPPIEDEPSSEVGAASAGVFVAKIGPDAAPSGVFVAKTAPSCAVIGIARPMSANPTNTTIMRAMSRKYFSCLCIRNFSTNMIMRLKMILHTFATLASDTPVFKMPIQIIRVGAKCVIVEMSPLSITHLNDFDSVARNTLNPTTSHGTNRRENQ